MNKPLLFLSILLISLTSFLSSCVKESPTKLYMINIYGEWCKTCSLVEPSLKEIMPQIKLTSGLKYLKFDQTNPKTLLESEIIAKKYNLEEVFEVERHTGEVIFVDAKTKKVLSRFYGLTDSKVYMAAVKKLLRGENFESMPAKRKEYSLSKPPAEEIKKAKLYVVDIHHDRCGGCATTAPVFEEVALDYKENSDVSFFTFDLTSPETVKETAALSKELGIYDIYKTHKHTGEVLFIDASSKEILKTIALEEDHEVYHEIIKKILTKT